MRRQLQAVLSRVERLAADAERQSTQDDPARLVAILLEGRQRAARAARSGEKAPQKSYEERLAEGRAWRARMAALRERGSQWRSPVIPTGEPGS